MQIGGKAWMVLLRPPLKNFWVFPPPPPHSLYLLQYIWNSHHEVKCAVIAKYKVQTPPLHHLPACWHDWEVRKHVNTEKTICNCIVWPKQFRPVSVEKKMPSTPAYDKDRQGPHLTSRSKWVGEPDYYINKCRPDTLIQFWLRSFGSAQYSATTPKLSQRP